MLRERGAGPVAFVVNGDERSAMARRAEGFARQLNADWPIELLFRTHGRLMSIHRLAAALVRMRPAATWVFDMALAGVVSSSLARVIGARMIVDTGDAITALARQEGTRGTLGVAATRGLEAFSLSTADALVVRGTEHQRLLQDRGYQATLIPDGVDVPACQRPSAREAIRREMNVSSELVVGLIGSTVWNPRLGLTYGWDLLEALALVRDLPVVGVIVGDGTGMPHLRARAAALGVEHRVRFLGRRPFEQLPELLAGFDVALSTQTNDVVGKVRTTGKLPLYMAAGRYVLASRVGEAARVLPDPMLIPYEGTVDETYPARLAERLGTLCFDRAQLQLGQSLVSIAQREFSYPVLAGRVDGVLRNVLAGAVPGRAAASA